MNDSQHKATILQHLFWEMLPPVRDALVVAIAAGVFGLAVNFIHPNAIPFLAEKSYEILVPCPVSGGPALALEASDPSIWYKDTVLVDARLKAEYQTWSPAGSVNVTYDYLDPTEPQVIVDLAKKIAGSGSKRVVVFGDGDKPDTGEQLGKEISGSGIKNVYFVKGGAPALRSETNREARP